MPSDTGFATLCHLPGQTIPALLRATAALTGTNPGKEPTMGRGEPWAGTSLPKPSQVPTQDVATIAMSDLLAAWGGDARPARVPGSVGCCCRDWFTQHHPPWFPQGPLRLASGGGAAAGAHVPWMGWVPVPG